VELVVEVAPGVVVEDVVEDVVEEVDELPVTAKGTATSLPATSAQLTIRKYSPGARGAVDPPSGTANLSGTSPVTLKAPLASLWIGPMGLVDASAPSSVRLKMTRPSVIALS
jgi:hypothetical protein